ncbi:MAG TPA: sensor histidine kinase [Firmicutes bacterium]|jgi:two-component system sensor histidine kinase DegS|nr:sensor histidine kinase [Bacillota bacterium]
MSDRTLLSTVRVENILRDTLDALEQGKNEMYDIAEHARQEFERLQAELEEVQVDVGQAISTVEVLEQRFKHARIRLYQMSRDYDHYSEQDKANAYREAERIRESLAVARERERNLSQQRRSLEVSLARVEEIASKAERFVSQVGVALNFLAGNIRDVNEQLECVQVKHEIAQGILKGQEDERKRLAREIHDGPVQDMANIALRLDIVERLYGVGRFEEAGQEFSSLKGLVKTIIGDIRRIIYDLSPMALDDLGLVHTVTRYVQENCERQGVHGEVRVVGREERLAATVEVAVFRTVQEAVNNSLRHGRPTEVLVRLEFLGDRIGVGVFDNGVGFNLVEVRRLLQEGRHYGLVGMEDRIKLLNGTLKIHSAPGQGTRIVATVPL